MRNGVNGDKKPQEESFHRKKSGLEFLMEKARKAGDWERHRKLMEARREMRNGMVPKYKHDHPISNPIPRTSGSFGDKKPQEDSFHRKISGLEFLMEKARKAGDWERHRKLWEARRKMRNGVN